MESVNVTSLAGTVHDPAYRDRAHIHVDIGWGDARKHRQVLVASNGVQVCIQLPRGTFLTDGAVLADDGLSVVVVRRPIEPAITVDFADNAGTDGARRMLLLGYLLGNQHSPLDVTGDRVATPLMTSCEAAQDVLEALHVKGSVGRISLATQGWSNTSADHHHSHRHDHDHDHG